MSFKQLSDSELEKALAFQRERLAEYQVLTERFPHLVNRDEEREIRVLLKKLIVEDCKRRGIKVLEQGEGNGS